MNDDGYTNQLKQFSDRTNEYISSKFHHKNNRLPGEIITTNRQSSDMTRRSIELAEEDVTFCDLPLS